MKTACPTGCADVVINNAGVAEKLAEIGDEEEGLESGWCETMEVNLKGTYLVTREFIKVAREVRKREGKTNKYNGVSNGTTNGVTNGASPGITNGASNGVTNGASNGITNGGADGGNAEHLWTVINTSSMGSYFTLPGLSAYQISKVAINKLTEFIEAGKCP